MYNDCLGFYTNIVLHRMFKFNSVHICMSQRFSKNIVLFFKSKNIPFRMIPSSVSQSGNPSWKPQQAIDSFPFYFINTVCLQLSVEKYRILDTQWEMHMLYERMITDECQWKTKIRKHCNREKNVILNT